VILDADHPLDQGNAGLCGNWQDVLHQIPSLLLFLHSSVRVDRAFANSPFSSRDDAVSIRVELFASLYPRRMIGTLISAKC
jgi:hypothetical protein